MGKRARRSGKTQQDQRERLRRKLQLRLVQAAHLVDRLTRLELAAAGRAMAAGVRAKGLLPQRPPDDHFPAEIIARIARQRKAGKWKRDNCTDCPWRAVVKGRARSWAELEQLKVKRKTCAKCPSRGLPAARP